jgi:hypothetical protein
LPSSNDIALSTAICRSSVTSDMYFRRSILILQRKSENATHNLHFFQKYSSLLFFWLKSGRGCVFSILARLCFIATAVHSPAHGEAPSLKHGSEPPSPYPIR